MGAMSLSSGSLAEQCFCVERIVKRSPHPRKPVGLQGILTDNVRPSHGGIAMLKCLALMPEEAPSR